MTPSSVVRTTGWREGMPSLQGEETWAGLRGGTGQTSWSSTRPSARSYAWVGAIPKTGAGWAMSGWRTALWRSSRGNWWMKNWMWNLLHSGLHQKERDAAQGILPLSLLWWDPTWNAVSGFGAPSIGKMWISWSKSSGRLGRLSEAWSTFHMRTGWESWCSSGWKRLWVDLPETSFGQSPSTWRGLIYAVWTMDIEVHSEALSSWTTFQSSWFPSPATS